MRKATLVCALIACASLAASAQSHNWNVSFDGNCDAMELTASGPSLIYVVGIHDFSACPGLGSSYNENIVGFRHSFFRTIDPGGQSTVIDVMDPSFGYIESLPYPIEYLIDTDQTCAWSSYYDFPGTGHVLANAGTCTFFKGTPAAVKDAPLSFHSGAQ